MQSEMVKIQKMGMRGKKLFVLFIFVIRYSRNCSIAVFPFIVNVFFYYFPFRKTGRQRMWWPIKREITNFFLFFLLHLIFFLSVWSVYQHCLNTKNGIASFVVSDRRRKILIDILLEAAPQVNEIKQNTMNENVESRRRVKLRLYLTIDDIMKMPVVLCWNFFHMTLFRFLFRSLFRCKDRKKKRRRKYFR